MEEKNHKLIKISATTDEKLKKIGQFGETYDQVINKIIDTCPIAKEEKTEKEVEPKETTTNEEKVVEVDEVTGTSDEKVEDHPVEEIKPEIEN